MAYSRWDHGMELNSLFPCCRLPRKESTDVHIHSIRYRFCSVSCLNLKDLVGVLTTNCLSLLSLFVLQSKSVSIKLFIFIVEDTEQLSCSRHWTLCKWSQTFCNSNLSKHLSTHHPSGFAQWTFLIASFWLGVASASRSVEVRTEDYEQYYKKQTADSNCGFAEEFEVQHKVSFMTHFHKSVISRCQVCSLSLFAIVDCSTCSNNGPQSQTCTRVVVCVHSLPHASLTLGWAWMLELNLLAAGHTQARDANLKSEWTGAPADEKEKEEEEMIDYSDTVPVLKDSFWNSHWDGYSFKDLAVCFTLQCIGQHSLRRIL